MRVTNIPPGLLCTRHLLREHLAIHQFSDYARSNRIQPYADAGLVEVHNLRRRHDEIANEMKTRTLFHWDKAEERKWQGIELRETGRVDPGMNLDILRYECPDCSSLIKHAAENGEVSAAPRLRGRTVRAHQREQKGWS
jgi:hypothetical protein